MNALAPSDGADLLHGFAPFGMAHLVTLAGCAAILAAVVLLARRLADTPQEWRMRQGLAIVALVYWVAYNTWWNWGGVDLRTGLPLQACDVSGLVAPFALLTLNRWLRSTLYFWAFAFATQAFIQPTVTDGPAHLVFWAFWAAHVVIMACGPLRPRGARLPARLERLCARRHRRRLMARDRAAGRPVARGEQRLYRQSAGRHPHSAAGRGLGPWPGRLIIIVAIAAGTFLLVLSPWLVARRLRAGTPRPDHAAADDASTAAEIAAHGNG